MFDYQQHYTYTGLFDVCADTKTAACALLNPLFGCGLAKRMGEPCLAGCGGQVAMRAVYRTKNGIDVSTITEGNGSSPLHGTISLRFVVLSIEEYEVLFPFWHF